MLAVARNNFDRKEAELDTGAAVEMNVGERPDHIEKGDLVLFLFKHIIGITIVIILAATRFVTHLRVFLILKHLDEIPTSFLSKQLHDNTPTPTLSS
ncbi:hypothetical protein BofuT4_uP045190.1 [Botrytis cinerea T4]|uniref:Uncharacterized protein n=1 Tax=Botryotinia fuckeliana (strain T4) TaxID=999810 RepID=G2XYG4_BOTF4|nr:hypothetical protein BofuT4_uP045190.1 [Botrytis cinerea T4]